MDDELIVRVLSGAASPGERETTDLWRRQSPQNEAYFRATLRAWSATAPPPHAHHVDLTLVRAIIDEANRRSALATRPARAAGRLREVAGVLWSLKGLTMAAALAAIAFGLRAAIQPSPATPVAVWEADPFQPRTIALGDGSVVRLAPAGRLTRLESGGERRFTLAGKAFFAVVHDDARPFVVEVGDVSIRDLGTRFEVDPDSRRIRTVVLEGRVSVASAGDSVRVTEGGVAVVPPGGAVTVTYPKDVERLLDWPDGVLIFQATPLDRAAREIERHFGKAVTVEDAAVRSRTISAWFGREGFEEVMDAICQAAAVACTVTDSMATIRAR